MQLQAKVNELTQRIVSDMGSSKADAPVTCGTCKNGLFPGMPDSLIGVCDITGEHIHTNHFTCDAYASAIGES